MIGTSADGKQIRKSKTCKTLKEAMKHRDDFLKLKSKNNAVAPSSSTLEDWVKKFLDDRKNDITACSYDSYKYAGKSLETSANTRFKRYHANTFKTTSKNCPKFKN